jgi:8-oxo-dGTP pyrophosphatase MutT (NUDIX family)
VTIYERRTTARGTIVDLVGGDAGIPHVEMRSMTTMERQGVRAILLTPEHEVLLMRIRPPDVEMWFWITPGGGLEPGETIEQGLRRELREELGLVQFRGTRFESSRSSHCAHRMGNFEPRP